MFEATAMEDRRPPSPSGLTTAPPPPPKDSSLPPKPPSAGHPPTTVPTSSFPLHPSASPTEPPSSDHPHLPPTTVPHPSHLPPTAPVTGCPLADHQTPAASSKPVTILQNPLRHPDIFGRKPTPPIHSVDLVSLWSSKISTFSAAPLSEKPPQTTTSQFPPETAPLRDTSLAASPKAAPSTGQIQPPVSNPKGMNYKSTLLGYQSNDTMKAYTAAAPTPERKGSYMTIPISAELHAARIKMFDTA